MKNYYSILGVDENASKDSIKKAYRKLAKEHHPDRNKSESDEKFKEISEAYSVLGDDTKRKVYNQQRKFSGGSPFPGINFDDFIYSSFRDVMNGGYRRGTKGPDVSVKVYLTFEEAVQGCIKEIDYPKWEKCSVCEGKRYTKVISTCNTCNGTGIHEASSGFVNMRMNCQACGGRGKHLETCLSCHGKGLEDIPSKQTVSFKPGIVTGDIAKINNLGMPSANIGPNGNLMLNFIVQKHKEFWREKSSKYDIHSNLKITYPEAVLGAKKVVKTIHGNLKVSINPGTSYDARLKIAHKGGKIKDKEYASHILHIKIDIPKEVSEELKAKLEEVNKILSDEQHLNQD